MDLFVAHTPAQLGAILRGYRQQRGLTQRELAARMGLPQKAVSIAETHPDRIGVARVFELLAALGVELALRDRSASKAVKAEW